MQNQPPKSLLDHEFEMKDFDTVPSGQYVAYFKDIQETNHEQWGRGVMFVFEVAAGEYKGQTATRIGKPDPTSKNSTGMMFKGITGSDQKTSLRPYVGKPYSILVEPTQGEKTRIGQVWPYQPQQSMPVANFNSAPVATEPSFAQPSPGYGGNPYPTPETQAQNALDNIPFG